MLQKRFYIFLILFIACENLFAQTQSVEPAVSTSKDFNLGKSDQQESDLKKHNSGFYLMFEPLILHFGFNRITLDPGSKVEDPEYFNNPNHEFGFIKEYGFGISAHFKAYDWLALGLGLNFSFEEQDFITDIVSGSSTAQRFYALNFIKSVDEKGNVLPSSQAAGSYMNKKYTGKNGVNYEALNLPYGVFRLELNPTLTFYPLKNAMSDLKGLYISLTPKLGMKIDSSAKIYMDILRSGRASSSGSNQLSNIDLGTKSKKENGSSTPVLVTPEKAVEQRIYSEESLAAVKNYLKEGEDTLSRYFKFYGGIQLDIGWNGQFKNGMVLNTSGGIGYDSSRNFYVQLKSSIGYFFK